MGCIQSRPSTPEHTPPDAPMDSFHYRIRAYINRLCESESIMEAQLGHLELKLLPQPTTMECIQSRPSTPEHTPPDAPMDSFHYRFRAYINRLCESESIMEAQLGRLELKLLPQPTTMGCIQSRPSTPEHTPPPPDALIDSSHYRIWGDINLLVERQIILEARMAALMAEVDLRVANNDLPTEQEMDEHPFTHLLDTHRLYLNEYVIERIPLQDIEFWLDTKRATSIPTATATGNEAKIEVVDDKEDDCYEKKYELLQTASTSKAEIEEEDDPFETRYVFLKPSMLQVYQASIVLKPAMYGTTMVVRIVNPVIRFPPEPEGYDEDTFKLRLSMFVACLCHDLDYSGYTNEFMCETASPLAAMYSTINMEHHQFNITVSILQQDECSVFKKFSREDYKCILENIRMCILATDLEVFLPNLAKLEEIKRSNTFSWKNTQHRELAMAITMTASDLSALAKPWDIQIKTVNTIFMEFYCQEKLEKAGKNPMNEDPMMDREKLNEMHASQHDDSRKQHNM